MTLWDDHWLLAHHHNRVGRAGLLSLTISPDHVVSDAGWQG